MSSAQDGRAATARRRGQPRRASAAPRAEVDQVEEDIGAGNPGSREPENEGTASSPPPPSTASSQTAIRIAEHIGVCVAANGTESCPSQGAGTDPAVTPAQMAELQRLLQDLARLNQWQMGYTVTVDFVRHLDQSYEARIAWIGGGTSGPSGPLTDRGRDIAAAVRSIIARRQAEIDAARRREADRQRAAPTYHQIVLPHP